MDNLTQIIEAVLFASGTPRKITELTDKLPEKITQSEFDSSINELKLKYNQDNSGIMLIAFNNKYQLTTNTKYGAIVSEILTELKEKELSKVLLEVLAIIAYKQPITRLEIERVKNSSAEYALSFLLKVNLVQIVGRKDCLGRPVLYGTTEEFLKKFQLGNIAELPDYNAVLDKLELIGEFHKNQSELYREVDVSQEAINSEIDEELIRKDAKFRELERNLDAANVIDDMLADEEDLPDFLKGEDIQIIES